LGKSGLIESYGETVRLCIEKALLSPIGLVKLATITFEYYQQNVISKLVLNHALVEINSNYMERVCITYACNADRFDAFAAEAAQLEHTGIIFEPGKTTHMAL
jgi:putative IMPACT (imprinted ancient) family translation regulator